MICEICGSSKFSNHGGTIYCSECNTQIEETREEEASEGLSYSHRSILSSPAVERTPVKKGKQEYGSWIMAEVYNIIIHEQVSALIKLGASPKLKPTVLHIWSKYLQACEIAFRKDYRAAEGVPRLECAPDKRDLKVLYGNSYLSKKKKRKTTKKFQEENEEQSSTSDTQSSDVDSDSTFSVTSSTSSVKSKLKYSSHAYKLLKNRRKMSRNTYKSQVHSMTLAKTLSFCHLGLLYTEDKLSLLDFIRFVNEERIPYINVYDKLPSYHGIRPQSDAFTLLKYAIPDAYSIHHMSLNIAKFLKLPKFKQPSIQLAVARYVKELNLPDDISPMVNVLIEQFREESSSVLSLYTEKVPHDYLAVAFIIVVLKMLFVLDGKFEMEHSKVITKLNIINPERKYFVWTEWKEQALLKEFLFLPENPFLCPLNKVDSLSADRIISKYPYTLLQPSPKEDSLNTHTKKSYLESKHEVKDILANVTQIPSQAESEPTSFPLLSKMKDFMHEWKTLKMYHRTKDIDFSILKKDFSSYSLSFNPFQFDSEEGELSYFLLTSLYLPEKLEDMYEYFFRRVLSRHEIIRTSSEYWFFDSEPGIKCPESIDKIPSSFRWLLIYVCKCTFMKHTLLYREITILEKRLFLNVNNKCYKTSLAKLKNKIIDN